MAGETLTSTIEPARLESLRDQERHAASLYAGLYDAAYESPYYVSERRSFVWTTFVHALRHGIYLPRARVLDVGCGTGNVLRLMQRLGVHKLSANDISAEMVDLASAKFPSVDFRVGPIEDQSYPPGSFDVVVGFSMLHHLPDLPLFFDWLSRVLRPGGVFAFSDPNDRAGANHRRWARWTTYPLHVYMGRRNAQQIARLPDMSDDSYYAEAHRSLTTEEITRALGPDLSARTRTSGFFAPIYNGVLVGQPLDWAVLYGLRGLDRVLPGVQGTDLLTFGVRSRQPAQAG